MSNLGRHSTFYNILTSIRSFPLWVLQGVYVEIQSLLKDTGSKTGLQNIDRTDMLQLYIPTLNSVGEKVIEKDSRERLVGSIPAEVLKFLESAKLQRTVIDICIANDWTLEECANLMLECIRNNYLERTYTSSIHTTLLFITGNIKVGEFLLKRGLITQTQLDWALHVQGDIDDTFDDTNKIVDVLTNLNYIEKDVIADVLSLKDFAKTKFKIVDNTEPLLKIIDELEEKASSLKKELEEKEKQLDRLEADKKLLENKLNSLQENFETLQKKNLNMKEELEQYRKKSGLFKKL